LTVKLDNGWVKELLVYDSLIFRETLDLIRGTSKVILLWVVNDANECFLI